MIPTRRGLLESINIRLDKKQLDDMNKTISDTKAVLDSIGSSSSASTASKK